MSFGVDDYEKAIVRIFYEDKQGKKTVIGTGFLVAPGYVLTCAHVVLQALGVEEKDFDTTAAPMGRAISLDFHVEAAGQSIQAEVVDWLPYSIEKGDVAALKLLAPEPSGATPIPLSEVSRTEVEGDRHFIYGFGAGELGGRSDLYQPKANAAGRRFQLCKFGNPAEDSIKPGFSGAPVWNDNKKCVIGMIATATDTQTIAYAIPVQALRPTLKRVDAFSLYDLLIQSLDDCKSDNERNQLTSAIDSILRRCNPQGVDQPWPEQLMDLSTDRAPVLGWETEGRLIHLAIRLALMDDIPSQAYDQLKVWVERCHWNFPDLFERLSREVKQQKISTTRVCQHLMVVVEQRETSTNSVVVSLWQVPDRASYDPQNPMLPVISGSTQTISGLPRFIRDQIRQKFRKTPTPIIHLFVPRSLFGSDIEMLPSSDLGATLGSEYLFIIRTNLKTHPIGYYYYDDWHEKWDKIEKVFDQATHSVFQSIDCSELGATLVAELGAVDAAILHDCDSVSDLFELIFEETALPVALWSRDSEFQDQLPTLLTCVFNTLQDRLRQERDTARQSITGKLLGHHLSLVWEDPKIVPPDMYFDPEAC
jgi:vWA-MoxR associated protein C-terminal domain/Trypsin-like peptidase domain/vWA-MoxR associated protein middle region (VMAP-M) 1